jgi:DNA polymerase-4
MMSWQPELPFPEPDQLALDATLDRLRSRFGAQSVTRAGQLGRDPELTMPVLPDPVP